MAWRPSGNFWAPEGAHTLGNQRGNDKGWIREVCSSSSEPETYSRTVDFRHSPSSRSHGLLTEHLFPRKTEQERISVLRAQPSNLRKNSDTYTMARVMSYSIQSLKYARCSRKKRVYHLSDRCIYTYAYVASVIQWPSVHYLEESRRTSPRASGHRRHLRVGFCSVFWNF